MVLLALDRSTVRCDELSTDADLYENHDSYTTSRNMIV